MKNLKKILALAVAFVMCFTMFAGAATFTDVTLGGDYSQAITFLSDLGVIAGKPDGSFGVNDAITRADAACLIARLMTGQPTPQKYDGHIAFTDVPAGSYYETSVGYCAALGITVGKGNGRFAPMDTITDGEFIAMLTRALGYDTAEHPLAFPMGNITQAQARGLLDGVKVEYASDALRGEDAQMLYNALFAEYDRAAANKNRYQGADDHWNVTIAEEAFGLGRLSHDTSIDDTDHSNIGAQGGVSFHGANRNNNPVVDCDAHTWVIAGVDAREKENTYVAFAIDDNDVKAVDPEDDAWSYQLFTYSGDVKPLLGYRVELWGEYDHSSPIWDVTAIKVVDGNLAGSRASTAGFESRYAANQAVYSYQPGMDDDDDTVTIDGKELYINKSGNVANNAKINLDINTTANWMWATETQQISAALGNIPSAIYAGFNNTFADNGPYYDRHADAYRLATVSADDGNGVPDPESNTLVKLNFRDGDRYTLFDWDGDDNIDFVVTDTAKYAEVVTKTATRMVIEADDRTYTSATARARGQYSLKLDDDNLKVEGADGIEEGDVIEITVVKREYTRADGEVLTIKVEKVDPEVKKLEKINVTRQAYTFDGEELTLADVDLFDRVELNAGGQSRDELDTIENIGKEFNLWFDRNGFLLKARVNDDSASGYLMILETKDGQDNLHTSTTALRRGPAVADVLFDDNTIGEEVEFATNLSIKIGNNTSTSANGYNSSTRSWNERMVVGNVYKYYMDEDGVITRLISASDYQGSNYSYDESKTRLNAVARDTVSGGADSNTNYGFDDKAVVFAVRSVTTDNLGNEVSITADGDSTWTNANAAVRRGYIRARVHDNLAATSELPGAVHFWVDPADVMAVSIDDVPEIDNRTRTANAGANNFDADNNGVDDSRIDNIDWTIPSYEVTHPSRFITWDLRSTTAQTSFASFNDSLQADNTVAANNAQIEAGRWMKLTTSRAGSWNTQEFVYHNLANLENNQGTTPAVAFNLNSKNVIEAAIMGVDSLNFFGASSAKLALITNVFATGKKSWEFQAAIDGKYDTFKTVTDTEDKIFKGYIGHNKEQNSYAAMRTYLDQDVDGYTGRRNALYAEVIMDKEGLIREVRALAEMQGTNDNTTFWGDDPIGADVQYLEGSVYRVIRGVTTQLGAKNHVTWQASPMASSPDTLYSMSEYNDWNAYDHLEADYDEDTKFYDVGQKPRMFTDTRVQVTNGFRNDLDGDLKPADSNILQTSLFEQEGQYFVCDYAVYKSNPDRLAAVFAFDDIADGVAMTPLTANNLNGVSATQYLTIVNKPAEGQHNDQWKIRLVGEMPEASTTDEAAPEPLSFTIKVNGVERKITFTGDANSAARTNSAFALGGDAADDATTSFSYSVDNGVITIEAGAYGDRLTDLDMSGAINAQTGKLYPFTLVEGGLVERDPGRGAQSTITVANNMYRVNDVDGNISFLINGTNGGFAVGGIFNPAGVRVVIPNGSYTGAQIAAIIRNALENANDADNTVGGTGREVTLTDTSAGGDPLHITAPATYEVVTRP